MNDQTPAQRFAAALQRFESSGDDTDLLARYGEGAELRRPEVVHQGPTTDAKAFWSAYRSQFDHIATEFSQISESDSLAALEWESRGRLSAGRDITYRGVSLLSLGDDGLVQRFATYYDTAAFLESGQQA